MTKLSDRQRHRDSHIKLERDRDRDRDIEEYRDEVSLIDRDRRLDRMSQRQSC